MVKSRKLLRSVWGRCRIFFAARRTGERAVQRQVQKLSRDGLFLNRARAWSRPDQARATATGTALPAPSRRNTSRHSNRVRPVVTTSSTTTQERRGAQVGSKAAKAPAT